LVGRKLAVLREHVERATRRRPVSRDALGADVDLQDALAMSLLVAIQEAIDIAFHMCTDEKWGLPATYAECFEILAGHDVITSDLAARLAATARLRNRLSHGYTTVDHARVWEELPAGLLALTQYAAAIAALLSPAGAR
jgi:uncharacterized protein YutE (UPF0331/DUF86 family)